MSSVRILRLEDSPFSLLDVFSLIREVYSDRKNEGIDFWLSKSSFEDYASRTDRENKRVYVAMDEASNCLLGTIALSIHNDKKGRKYGGVTNCAVERNSQSKCIGSRLLEKLKDTAMEEGCYYLKSTTAVNAVGSVKWHLKNGFKKCGLASSSKSNYYSYVFILPLIHSRSFYNRVLYKFDYGFSWLLTRCLLKQDGNLTMIGTILKRIKGR